MKRLLLVALTVIGFSAIAYAGVEVAWNCTYSGNDADYCYCSDGTHNFKVLYCRPGETDCFFEWPPVEEDPYGL